MSTQETASKLLWFREFFLTDMLLLIGAGGAADASPESYVADEGAAAAAWSG